MLIILKPMFLFYSREIRKHLSSSKHFSKSMLFNVYGELPGNHFFNNDTIKRANKLCKEIVHVTLDKGGHRKIL